MNTPEQRHDVEPLKRNKQPSALTIFANRHPVMAKIALFGGLIASAQGSRAALLSQPEGSAAREFLRIADCMDLFTGSNHPFNTCLQKPDQTEKIDTLE